MATKANELDPNNAAMHFGKAQYLFNINQVESLNSLNQTILIKPNFASYPYHMKAIILHEKNKDNEALETLEDGISIFPDEPDLYLLKADILEKLNRRSEAMEVREKAGGIDMERIFAMGSGSRIKKLEKLLNRLRELFEDNNWKELKLEDVLQVLDLEDGLNPKFNREAIEELIRDGTLYRPKSNHIKFTPRRE